MELLESKGVRPRQARRYKNVIPMVVNGGKMRMKDEQRRRK
jgi:hypothetical protein